MWIVFSRHRPYRYHAVCVPLPQFGNATVNGFGTAQRTSRLQKAYGFIFLALPLKPSNTVQYDLDHRGRVERELGGSEERDIDSRPPACLGYLNVIGAQDNPSQPGARPSRLHCMHEQWLSRQQPKILAHDSLRATACRNQTQNGVSGGLPAH